MVGRRRGAHCAPRHARSPAARRAQPPGRGGIACVRPSCSPAPGRRRGEQPQRADAHRCPRRLPDIPTGGTRVYVQPGGTVTFKPRNSSRRASQVLGTRCRPRRAVDSLAAARSSFDVKLSSTCTYPAPALHRQGQDALVSEELAGQGHALHRVGRCELRAPCGDRLPQIAAEPRHRAPASRRRSTGTARSRPPTMSKAAYRRSRSRRRLGLSADPRVRAAHHLPTSGRLPSVPGLPGVSACSSTTSNHPGGGGGSRALAGGCRRRRQLLRPPASSITSRRPHRAAGGRAACGRRRRRRRSAFCGAGRRRRPCRTRRIVGRARRGDQHRVRAGPPTSPAGAQARGSRRLGGNGLGGAQLPVLLAIVAIIALSLVTATYARMYLLRKPRPPERFRVRAPPPGKLARFGLCVIAAATAPRCIPRRHPSCHGESVADQSTGGLY